jgi:hypothetical protein
LGASKQLDPKYLILDGVYFGRYSGTDAVKREPELLFPRVAQRKVYGAFRKISCFLLGPQEDGLVAAYTTPVLRVFFFFWDTSRS